MPKNHDPLKSVTVVLLVDNTAETLVHSEVLSPERFRTTIRDAAHAALERDPDPDKNAKRPGRPGKPVEILEVNASVLTKYAGNGAPHPDEFLNRRVFESMSALSAFLGVTPSACFVALNYARSTGRRHATVRGVTFIPVEEAPE